MVEITTQWFGGGDIQVFSTAKAAVEWIETIIANGGNFTVRLI
jgi:hypothetical protein